MDIQLLQYLDSQLYVRSNNDFEAHTTTYDQINQQLICKIGKQKVKLNTILNKYSIEAQPFKYYQSEVELEFENDNTTTQVHQIAIVDKQLFQEVDPQQLNLINKHSKYQFIYFFAIPYSSSIQCVIANEKYQLFENTQLCKKLINEKFSQQFISTHKSQIHKFFEQKQIHNYFKLKIFKQVFQFEEFHIYNFAKVFKLVQPKIDVLNLQQVCMYITSKQFDCENCKDKQTSQPFNKEELLCHINKLIQDANTWIIENEQVRSYIGITSSYLHYSPFDRLSGNFTNDRIVLFTYLIMKNDVSLFKQSLTFKGYLAYSIFTDLPGFGIYFFDHNNAMNLNQILKYVNVHILNRVRNKRHSQINYDIQEAYSTNDYITKFQLDKEKTSQFPYITLAFEMLKEYSEDNNIQMNRIRSMVKLVDALLHSYLMKDLYEFIVVTVVHWCNYIYQQLSCLEYLQIKDCMRLSGSLQSLFYEFAQYQDKNVLHVLSLLVFSLHQLCMEKIKTKQSYTIKDRSLPLGFEGEQMVICYYSDIYEWRSMQNIHIIAEPGQCEIFSSKQLNQIVTNIQTNIKHKRVSSEDTNPKMKASIARLSTFYQNGQDYCIFCKESVARIMKKLLALNNKPAQYYFDSALTQRPCPLCNNDMYFLKDENEFNSIILKQNTQSLPFEFADDKMYKNVITQFINIDNSVEQLQNNYNLNIQVNKMIKDHKKHRVNVKRIMNNDGQMIYNLNELKDIINYLKQDVDTLDFSSLEDIIRLTVDIDNDQKEYDGFAEYYSQPMQQDTPSVMDKQHREKSVRTFLAQRDEDLKRLDVDGVNSTTSIHKNISEVHHSIRVYVIEEISVVAALISILRAQIKSNFNIYQILDEEYEQQHDAYQVFYKNEQILGKPIGLPSFLSIFGSSHPFVPLNFQHCYCHQLNSLVNMKITCKNQYNHYMATLDGSVLHKYQANFSNNLMLEMLQKTYNYMNIDQISELHAKQFYKNTICTMLQAVKLNDDTPSTISILKQVQKAMDDYSDQPFTSNWLIDSYKNERNKNLQKQLKLQVDQRKSSWPEFFEIDMQQESYTSNGLGYIPGFERFLMKIRDLLYSDEQISRHNSILYQFCQYNCCSKVVCVQRQHRARMSLQAMTVQALLNNPELLKQVVLNKDDFGFMTVKHLSIDTIQILLNNGELGLLVQWATCMYTDILKYLNVKPSEVNYTQFVESLVSSQRPQFHRQFFLKYKLQEYYTNQLIQVILSIYALFGAIQESNSIMTASLLIKIASIPRFLTGDPLFAQIQAKALIQLKILLQMPLKIRVGKMLETIQFNNRKLIPLITKVQYVMQINLLTDVHLVFCRDVKIDGSQSQNNLNLIKAMLQFNNINNPIQLKGQMYSVEQQDCELIIDQNSLEGKIHKVTCIIADHQLYIYHGKNLDIYVGAISLVNTQICFIEHKRQKQIVISTKFPRVRHYIIKTNDRRDIDQLYISLVGAIV